METTILSVFCMPNFPCPPHLNDICERHIFKITFKEMCLKQSRQIWIKKKKKKETHNVMACTITNHTMYSVFGLKNINAQIWMLIKEAEDY